jgi:hypothetical protein
VNHKDIRTTDDLIKWLLNNTMAYVDTTGYINKYLVETVDVLVERNVAPVRVVVDVKATYGEAHQLIGYLTSLSVWEGNVNFNAQFLYFPVMENKITSVLVMHRPGT